jgi:hypothetical protein
MKTLRLFVVILVAVMVMSVWTPAFASAPAPATNTAQVQFAEAKTATLTVDNSTGGTLYVSLQGPKSYWFSTSKSGKTTFKNIAPGKYTITVRTSGCRGTLTYNKSIKGKASLKRFICRH